MKNKEFNLSNERKELSSYGLENSKSLGGAAKFYHEDDVKEFIRLLKEEILSWKTGFFEGEAIKSFFILQIEKLAGDKLK